MNLRNNVLKSFCAAHPPHFLKYRAPSINADSRIDLPLTIKEGLNAESGNDVLWGNSSKLGYPSNYTLNCKSTVRNCFDIQRRAHCQRRVRARQWADGRA